MAERPIRDARDLRETLETRARCFQMLKVCESETCRRLTERHLSKLRATQAEGMRGPTLNETRRAADREIFSHILSWVAKGEGSAPGHHFRDSWILRSKTFQTKGRIGGW